MKEIKIRVIVCFSYNRLFNFTTPSVSEQHQADAGYGAPGSVLECLRMFDVCQCGCLGFRCYRALAIRFLWVSEETRDNVATVKTMGVLAVELNGFYLVSQDESLGSEAEDHNLDKRYPATGSHVWTLVPGLCQWKLWTMGSQWRQRAAGEQTWRNIVCPWFCGDLFTPLLLSDRTRHSCRQAFLNVVQNKSLCLMFLLNFLDTMTRKLTQYSTWLKYRSRIKTQL